MAVRVNTGHFIEAPLQAAGGSLTDGRIALSVEAGRAELYEELHNRPSPRIEAPCLITQLAIRWDGPARDAELGHLQALCQRFSVSPPRADAACFFHNFGGFELTWEKHTEFSTYTFVSPNAEPTFFSDSALRFVPRDWLAQLPGQMVAATHMTVVPVAQTLSRDKIATAFEGMLTSGSRVAEGQAEILTSFRIHSDGFARIIVRNIGLNPYQVGRLVQNILEIEAYRLLALLGLPIARRLAPEVTHLENSLADINQRIAAQGDVADDQAMLDALSTVAAQVEKFRSDTNYRFAATNAYFDLVLARLQYLREMRLLSTSEQPLTQLTLQEFLDRRLGPGVNTCNSVRARMEDLSRRVAQTSGLLRTRVELSIATQNQHLLASMDRRSQQQLRMQQAVEGFSVAAISYYLVGLTSYLLEGLIDAGAPLSKGMALALCVPVIVLLVWRSIRGFMRSVHAPAAAPDQP